MQRHDAYPTGRRRDLQCHWRIVRAATAFHTYLFYHWVLAFCITQMLDSPVRLYSHRVSIFRVANSMSPTKILVAMEGALKPPGVKLWVS